MPFGPAGIEAVFGSDQPVQRCRNHKMRNVLDELPREQHAQVVNVMRLFAPYSVQAVLSSLSRRLKWPLFGIAFYCPSTSLVANVSDTLIRII